MTYEYEYGDQIPEVLRVFKPNAFTQIAKVAQLAEVVMIRDNKERIFQTAR